MSEHGRARDAAGAPGASPAPAALVAPATSATIGALLDAVADALSPAGAARPADARQTARDVIAALLEVPRLWPAANRDAPCDAACRAAALAAGRRIARGEPFAYAVGRASFRHLTLDVDARVLIPRPETEVLVDLVLAEAPRGGTVVDVGTGSGAIALSLAVEGGFARVIATDVSLDALAVARRNADRLDAVPHAPVEFRHGSLLAPLAGERVAAVVSNPPYIAFEEAPALPPSVRDWEPGVALFSGADGMSATAALVRQAADALEPGGYLAVEVDTRRAMLAAELAASDGRYRDVAVRLDLTGRERFVTARRR